MTGKIIKCSNCGSTLDVSEGYNKIFCLYCGVQNLLTDVLEIPGVGLKCLSCGTRNKDEAIYCTKCGSSLQKECPFCKEIHTHDTIYCSKTGRNIKEYESERDKKQNEQENKLEEHMILIPSGNFLMGSNKIDEKPIHNVTVSSFYMGKYEVTNKEFCLFDSSHNNPGDNLPVVDVSWFDAVNYCKWLSENNGKNYRLPTESEWEYACRAGSISWYYWGDKIDNNYCWYDGNSGGKIHPVGQKNPNTLGLYDMLGNVNEWCSDWYGNYSSGSVTNPTGPSSGTSRIFRGGSYRYGIDYCRSAVRSSSPPGYRIDYVGFRIARTLLSLET